MAYLKLWGSIHSMSWKRERSGDLVKLVTLELVGNVGELDNLLEKPITVQFDVMENAGDHEVPVNGGNEDNAHQP